MTDKLRQENEKRIRQNVDIIANKIEKLMNMIPPELDYMKSAAAEQLAYQSVLDGSHNHYEAIGILEEAKLNFREVSHAIHEAEAKEADEENNTDSPGVDTVDEDSSASQEQEESNT